MTPPPTVLNHWSPHATMSGNMDKCHEQLAGSGVCSAGAEPLNLKGTLRHLDGGHVASIYDQIRESITILEGPNHNGRTHCQTVCSYKPRTRLNFHANSR